MFTTRNYKYKTLEACNIHVLKISNRNAGYYE